MRTAITVGQSATSWVAYFGDDEANVHAIDAVTGQALWKVHVDDFLGARITGAPTLVGTTLFVPVASVEEVTATDPKYACCSFRGSIVAFNLQQGINCGRT